MFESLRSHTAWHNVLLQEIGFKTATLSLQLTGVTNTDQ